MKFYAICYDLKSPGKDYGQLHEAIKVLGNAWWHYLDSTWLIRTNMSASQIRDRLRPMIDANDNLLVIEVTGEFSGWLPQKAGDWLRKYTSVAAEQWRREE